MKLKNKKILVGVTGGIAAYKTCTLVNMFIKEGAEVRVVMTDSAKNFVTPLTFQALTNNQVYYDLWNSIDQDKVEHISLSHWPDIIVVSPVTANTMAKIVIGMADNLLTTVILAALPQTKIILAPAMNVNIWENVIVQKNLRAIRDAGKFVIVEPRSGILACRDEGKGKIADVNDIFEYTVNTLK